MAYPTDKQIRVRAHRLWEEAGKPEGREHEFWHQAERQLQHQENQPNLPDNSVGRYLSPEATIEPTAHS
jgi:hypothetical protein